MSVKKHESFSFTCDACGEVVACHHPSLPAMLIFLASERAYVSEEDNSGFCARCMKIYRCVALSIIPEAFEGKDGAACGLKP